MRVTDAQVAHQLDKPLADVDRWGERGRCAETDAEAWYPEKGASTRSAKRVCMPCEVREECLVYALLKGERFGVWGGLSERERRQFIRGRRVDFAGALAYSPAREEIVQDDDEDQEEAA